MNYCVLCINVLILLNLTLNLCVCVFRLIDNQFSARGVDQLTEGLKHNTTIKEVK